MTFLCRPAHVMQFPERMFLLNGTLTSLELEVEKHDFSMQFWIFHLIPSQNLSFWILTQPLGKGEEITKHDSCMQI